MQSIRRVINWLGPTRARVIFALLALTALGSLALSAFGQQAGWVPPVQSGLLVIFLFGASLTVLSRFSPDERRQFALVILPAVGALSLGLFFSSMMAFFGPVGIGWLLISLIAVRGRVRREYQAAIKAMRKGEYDQAIAAVSGLIEAEPENADHPRFRAELYRLAGKIKQARADYEKVIALRPDSGVGYTGLAEVYLQDGEFESALPYAKQALEREPDDWVASYNLGMIEDRLNLWSDCVRHLELALRVGVPDGRHRLLIHLWLARACYRQGKMAEAERELQNLNRERSGLHEWRTIFENEEAAVLRSVLLDDVQLAERLAAGGAALDALAKVEA
jgi:tetratricopeptide (TPR) repeat protein